MKTNNKLIKSQEGIAHLGLIVLVVAVVGVVGFGAWRVVSHNKDNNVQTAEMTDEDVDAILNQVEDDSTAVSDNTEDGTNFTDQAAASEVDGGSNNASF